MHNSEQPKWARARVLVVDDDRSVSVALERSLRYLGYEVLVATDGADGFEQALRSDPAVVLADVHMPGMDGHALLRRLMRSELKASVILMSGQGELDDAIGAFRAGAVDYLRKPWAIGDLAAVLDRAMGLASALRELNLPPSLDHGVSPPADETVGGTDLAQPLDGAAVVERLARAAKTAQGLDVPSPRPAVEQLREAANGKRPAIDDMNDLLQQDARLSGAVLRSVAGIEDVRLPIDARALVEQASYAAIHEVMETLALRDAFPIRVAALRTLNDRVWRFSVSRALAMRAIADISDLRVSCDRHQYFLAGLLLDVGATYLLSEISTVMERHHAGVSDPVRMTAAVVAHHARIGALVLTRWGLPSEWVALSSDHHSEPPPLPEHLCCAAVLGGALAVRLAGFGDPSGDRELRSDSLARCAYTLGMGDTGLRRLTKSLTEDAERIWATCN